MEYGIKDSGERRSWETGSQRDLSDDKPAYGLIDTYFLRRLADRLQLGAKKYDANNWKKGQPLSVFYDSALRHLYYWAEGRQDGEDHLAAAAFNIMGLIYGEKALREGLWPIALDDMFEFSVLSEPEADEPAPTLDPSKNPYELLVEITTDLFSEVLDTLPRFG